MKLPYSGLVFSRDGAKALLTIVAVTVALALPGAAGIVTQSLLLLAVLVGAYFLPTIVAHNRKVPNQGSVAVINALLGWTFVGWIVALAMAARSVPKA